VPHTESQPIPTNYYRNNVIGAAGPFVMAAEDLSSFGQVMIQNLIAGIAVRTDHKAPP